MFSQWDRDRNGLPIYLIDLRSGYDLLTGNIASLAVCRLMALLIERVGGECWWGSSRAARHVAKA